MAIRAIDDEDRYSDMLAPTMANLIIASEGRKDYLKEKYLELEKEIKEQIELECRLQQL